MLVQGTAHSDGTGKLRQKHWAVILVKKNSNGNSLPFPSLELMCDRKARECLELCLLFEKEQRKTSIFVIKI